MQRHIEMTAFLLQALALVKLAIAVDADITQKIKSQKHPAPERSCVLKALKRAAHLYDTGALFLERTLLLHRATTENTKDAVTADSILTATRIAGYRARASALRKLFSDDPNSKSSGRATASGK